MGYKILCVRCRKSFNRGNDFSKRIDGKCPDCGDKAILITHRFRPPGKNEDQKWNVVQFLIANGFLYQHVYEHTIKGEGKTILSGLVKYPETMREAKDFVEKYKEQAIKV